ncbi:hypothetical protein IWX90DRAFT_421876 [Phyllosticta citrichinensis]|uniref:Actin-related protein n=1 Tax=Phyllosticta citrichinensis TaxID=1130410 RepID=A0ABR1Y7S0_9PEZI
MSAGAGDELLGPPLPVARTRPSSGQLDPIRKASGERTSSRAFSGIYGSSTANFRSDEEHLVLEFGARYLRAGFAGESKPRCTKSFGPEEQRRVGDFRRWMPGYEFIRKKRKRGQDWGQDYELWTMDLRSADMGLVEDKIERAVREIVAQYLLLDHRPRRATVVIPPLLPRPLLSALLSSVFTTLQAASITVLSGPVLSVVSAGLRSGLVIDLGWEETSITAVYEYREIHHRTSIRAGKVLTEEVAKLLDDECCKARKEPPVEPDQVSFEEAEEVLTRVGWCFSRDEAQNHHAGVEEDSKSNMTIPFPAASPPITISVPFQRFAEPAESALFASGMDQHEIDDHDQPIPLLAYNALLSLPIDARKLCMSRIIITGGVAKLPGIKRRILAEIEHIIDERGWDPVKNYGHATSRRDLRMPHRQQQSRKRASTMMADVVPPLPSEQQQQHQDLGSPRPTTGSSSATDTIPETPEREEASPLYEQARMQTPTPSQSTATTGGMAATPHTPPPASLQPQESDPISSKLASLSLKHNAALHPSPTGVVRGVGSLGAWAGASLVSSLRVRGIVEIEKDRFMQHGLATATREPGSVEVAGQLAPGAAAGPGGAAAAACGSGNPPGSSGGGQPGERNSKRLSSLGSSGGAGGKGDRGSWTLGVWA